MEVLSLGSLGWELLVCWGKMPRDALCPEGRAGDRGEPKAEQQHQ